MNNSDIDLIRKKYSSLILEKKRIKNIRDKILKLESDPKVKEYITLTGVVGNITEEKNQKDVLDSISKIVSYTKDSNKLLYDYGEVQIVTYEEFGSDYESDFKHVYRDLETTEYYFEMIDTIEPMPPEWRVWFNTSDREYYSLRNYFIEQIINRPQEDVVEELLHNNKQLVKGK